MPDATTLPIAQPRIPSATYRLQFHRGFTFNDARALLPYLETLGISDVYASPFFQAAPGSTHGYDVVDHNRLNDEVGTEAEFDALTDDLRARGMGLIADFVPNHMGIGQPTNLWWMDVLENGPSSVYARCFDIDFHPAKHGSGQPGPPAHPGGPVRAGAGGGRVPFVLRGGCLLAVLPREPVCR